MILNKILNSNKIKNRSQSGDWERRRMKKQKNALLFNIIIYYSVYMLKLVYNSSA